MIENDLHTTLSPTIPPTTPRLDCPSGWYEAENKCYKLYRWYSDISKRLDWYEAESFCKKLNGHLASFTSINSTNTILTAYSIYSFTPDISIWIGLNKIDSNEGYVWSDGTPANYFSWDEGQPDDKNGVQNCVELRSNTKWRDAFCYASKDWFCSINKGVNPNENAVEIEASIPSIN